MFNIPSKYRLDAAVDPKRFIAREMKKAEKDRVKENLLAARLVWQIAGEEIPSRVDENYNCSVIMGLECRLKSIKDAAFFAELVQQMVKEPCVVRFYDHAEDVYSFAHKRLSHTDSTQIVILDRVQTLPFSQVFPDRVADKLRSYLDFGSMKNRTDKLGLYLEATVKAFIISNLRLYSGMKALLDNKVWYNQLEFMALFERLIELARLNAKLKAEKLPGERARLHGEIKRAMEGLR